MAFGYLAGVTTPGAPDEIIDWFATFQNWMTGVLGWTVEAGGGTVDIIFRSLGEVGGLANLYMRVWRVGVGNTIRIEMQNDLGGTQTTAEGGTLDSGGVQFSYWMSGDMDAINICWKLGAGYRSIYAGMVIPFALTIPDETYQMVATSQLDRASILRDWNNVWDVDINNTDHTYLDNAIVDNYDGSFTLAGLWANLGVNVAGQYRHISGLIVAGGIAAEDTITTGRPGATSEWIVLADNVPNRYAMRTGGVLPTGISMQGGGFAVTNGVAVSHLDLQTRIAAFLVAIGWTDLGDPGTGTRARLLYTPGESGVDNCWTLWEMTNGAPDVIQVQVWNDALGTRIGGTAGALDDLEFPLNYWITGDLDCWMIVCQRPAGYEVFWLGILEAFVPGLIPPYAGASLTEFKSSANRLAAGSTIIRKHDGTWGGAVDVSAGVGGNTNPNAFDGVTYNLWPYALFFDVGAGNYESYGQMKYAFHTQGGGIANLDTITVGAEVYTIFFNVAGNPYAMRTT